MVELFYALVVRGPNTVIKGVALFFHICTVRIVHVFQESQDRMSTYTMTISLFRDHLTFPHYTKWGTQGAIT